MKKPIIGITMGDPAGNGSEISVKALSRSEIYEQCLSLIHIQMCIRDRRSFGDDKVLVFLNTGTGSVTLTSVEVPQLQEKRIILSSCEGQLLVVL